MAESDVFEIFGATALAPVFLTAEHAYAGVPSPLEATAEDRQWLKTHWGYDLGVRNVVQSWVDASGATAVCSRVTRLICDHNRALGDPTWTRRHVEGHTLSFNRDLDSAEIKWRERALWAPYHWAVEAQLDRYLAAGVRPYLISVHSFTPSLYGESRDFDLGMLFNIYAEDAHTFGAAAAEQGLRTRYNEPYSGRRSSIYSISRHGLAHRLPFLEIELNQGLIADPERAFEVGVHLAAAAEALILAQA